MQPARDSAQSIARTSTAAQSTSHRLFSRLTSGLASKPRSVVDFYIKLDDDGRRYSTGDTVKGSVCLRVLKPVRITHLVVHLSGSAQAYKHPNTPGHSHRANSNHSTDSKVKSTGQYHGNGFATLFEEEAVLCGDGRLAESSYQFNFELSFPDGDLPSSVDFERGKISYAITALLTRPTTISPVSSCEREIYFTERIDIASLYPPKSRTTIHDPLRKHSKAKTSALKVIDANDHKTIKLKSIPGDTQPSGEASSRPSVSSQDNDRPLSVVSSEFSTESHVSSTGMPSQQDSMSAPGSPTASCISRPIHSLSERGHKAIETTIESCSGGCLRGDTIIVKVHVKHTKYMKSMNGVIVTLYRHARVDTQPALPVGPLDKGKWDSKQSYYPRSVTGLGGLSLSGAGSAHIFRKDLAQAVFPLVVNPTTMLAEVNAKLRVPEEVFPTISGVPGAMISFKYYVEVIVDVQGKLFTPANPLRELTSTNMAPAASYETDYSNTAAHASRILDTAYVRKDKTVVCSAFEIIIGTVDSERRKGKQKVVAAAAGVATTGKAQREAIEPACPLPSHPPTFDSVQPDSYPAGQQAGSSSAPDYLSHTPTNGANSYPTMYPVPPMADESQQSEKERMQLAEARLLPSEPPGVEGELDGTVSGATAPQLDEDYDTTAYNDAAPQDEYATVSSSRVVNGANIQQYAMNGGHDEQHQPVASDLTSSGNAEQAHQDREQAATPVANSEMAGMHDSHAEASASSDLPRYER